MAHGDSRVVVSGGIILNRFRTFLERLSQEIEQDQLEGFKFILQDTIPLAHLEKCSTPRQLFTIMIQQDLLGEGKLANLEKLLTEVQRHDLVKRLEVYKQRELPDWHSSVTKIIKGDLVILTATTQQLYKTSLMKGMS